MNQGNMYSISEFSRLSGISRYNLIFYDKCGVLKPERVERNGYRRYGIRQLGTAYLVMTLKEFGMPLKQIKSVASSRTPESILHIFTGQKQRLERDVKQLQQRLQMIHAYEDSIRKVDAISEKSITVKRLMPEFVYRGPIIKKFRVERLHDYYLDFFYQGVKDDIPLGFPTGRETTKSSLLKMEWGAVHRFYYRMPYSKQKRNGGLYVIGYSRGDYYGDSPIYSRFMNYIDKHNFEIIGNAYEEYLLDEISTVDPSEYLMQVLIPIRG